MINHTIAGNLFGVINASIFKFIADDLQFAADVTSYHFGNAHTNLYHCNSTYFIKDALPSTATY